MPLKLTVGLSRKVGQPHYGSLGAACSVEVELDASLLAADPEAFHERVRQVFDSCARAVTEELARRCEPDGVREDETDRDGRFLPRARLATRSQLRALRAISGRRDLDLHAILGTRHGVDAPEELTIAEASRLIDDLQREPADASA